MEDLPDLVTWEQATQSKSCVGLLLFSCALGGRVKEVSEIFGPHWYWLS